MDVRALEAFCAAIDAGSFGKACEGRYVSRQALSRTIHTLEREVGAPLFVRGAAGVVPTELARMLEPHARRVVEECRAMEADVRKFRMGQVGTLRLAIEPNAVMTLPTGALGRYRELRPDVDVTLVTATGTAALEELATGAVDALLSVPMGSDAFAYRPICRRRLAVVTRVADAGAGAAGASDEGLAALRGITLFGVAQEHPLEASLANYLAERGAPVRMSYDYPSAMLALEAMQCGLGGCIMTQEAAGRFAGDAGYRVVALEEADAPQWEVGVTYRRGSSKTPVVEDLATCLAAIAAEA